MRITFLYDLATGRITQCILPAIDYSMMIEGIGTITVEDGDPDMQLTHYVSGGALTEKTGMDLSYSHSVAVGEEWGITGIPEETIVFYPGGEIMVNDGYLSWSSVEPGRYEFRLRCAPYFDEVVYAEITAA